MRLAHWVTAGLTGAALAGLALAYGCGGSPSSTDAGADGSVFDAPALDVTTKDVAPNDAANDAGSDAPNDAATDAATLDITTVTPVTAGARGVLASVVASAGTTYAWSITNGTLTTPASGVAAAGRNVVAYNAGSPGTTTIQCVATGDGGTAAGQATVQVIARAPHLYLGVPGTGVAAYDIDTADGGTSFIGSSASTSSVPVVVRADPSATHLYVGQNNSAIHLNEFPLDPDSGAPASVIDTGPSCTMIFAVAIDPTGSYGYYTCGGLVVEATISGGAMTPMSGSPVSVDPNGAGPLAIEPSGHFLYAGAGGTKGNLYRYSIGVTGALGAQKSEATTGFAWNDIGIDPTGKFLYASECDQLDAFAIATSTGDLTSVNTLTTPYNRVAIEPGGRYLYGLPCNGVAGIYGAWLDPSTGALTALPGSPFMIPASESGSPTSIAIAPTDNLLYATEFDNKVYAYRIQPDGTLLSLGPVATLSYFAETATAIY